MKNRIFRLPTVVKATLGGLLLYTIGCASNGYVNPTTRTQPLIPIQGSSAPVEPAEQVQIEQPTPVPENPAIIEVKVSYKIANKKAYEDLCSIVQAGKKTTDVENVLFAASIAKKDTNVNEISLDELTAAFASQIKAEELPLSYSEKIYAKAEQKEEVKEAVEKKIKDLKTAERIQFIEEIREQETPEFEVAAEVPLTYKVAHKKAFEALCDLVKEKEGKKELSVYEQILLAVKIDSDKDGTATVQDILKEYARLAPEETFAECSQEVYALPKQKRIVRAGIEEKTKGMTQEQKIGYIRELRAKKQAPSASQPSAAQPPSASYAIADTNVQMTFDKICDDEKRTTDQAKEELKKLMDTNGDHIITADESNKYFAAHQK